MDAYFRISDLRVSFRSFEGTKTVLDIDHIAIEKGKTFGLVGESGAGKTVLALAIQKLLPCPPGIVERGKIILDGRNLLERTEAEMRRIRGRKIAMIFQDPMSTLNPVFTVGYQMTKVAMETQGIRRAEAAARALEMTRTVKLPDSSKIMAKYPHELSGGQRQRIIIAMALLCGADFIIADEPTRNLDVTIQAGILRLIAELQKEFGVTVLFIANNLGLVSVVCDEMGILREGRIVERGRVRDILDNPAHEYTRLLIDSVTPRKRGSERRDLRSAETLLEVRSLRKYFTVKKGFAVKKDLFVKAVDGVDFSIRRGETVGIVGESGCGKSTLVNTLLLLEKPTAGTVLFNGREIFELGRHDLRKARRDVQIVFQDPFWSLNPRWTVKEIIGEPLKVHASLGYDEYMEAVGSTLEMVGIPRDCAFEYPHEFSGGQRQRIAIARALSVQPTLVVLDEPTSAIDVLSQSQILGMLMDLKERLGLTYIIISHDLSVVNFMADTIIVMYLGEIVEFGEAARIFESPMHPYTVALFNSIPDLSMRGIDEIAAIKGEVPSAIDPPEGCRFHPRCEHCMDICRSERPAITEAEGRMVACHLIASGRR